MNVRETAKRWFAKAPAARGQEHSYAGAEPAQAREAIDPEYLDKVHEAWLQWQAAQNYFENVSDPDLVDYAIYDLEAARRRYIYMLKQVER